MEDGWSRLVRAGHPGRLAVPTKGPGRVRQSMEAKDAGGLIPRTDPRPLAAPRLDAWRGSVPMPVSAHAPAKRYRPSRTRWPWCLPDSGKARYLGGRQGRGVVGVSFVSTPTGAGGCSHQDLRDSGVQLRICASLVHGPSLRNTYPSIFPIAGLSLAPLPWFMIGNLSGLLPLCCLNLFFIISYRFFPSFTSV